MARLSLDRCRAPFVGVTFDLTWTLGASQRFNGYVYRFSIRIDYHPGCSAALAATGAKVPWQRRRKKGTTFGTVIVVMMVAIICVAMLVWAGVILDVHVLPSIDAEN